MKISPKHFPIYLKRITLDDRRLFAEKSIELGNLIFAGLVIAQIIPGTQPIRPLVFILGIFGLMSLYIIAVVLLLYKR